jgi:hypothetical protein
MTVRRSGMSYALLYVPNPLSGRRVDYQLLTSIHRTLGALSRDWRTSTIRSAATALEPSPRSAAQHRREPRPDDGALPVLVDGCAGARLERTAPRGGGPGNRGWLTPRGFRLDYADFPVGHGAGRRANEAEDPTMKTPPLPLPAEPPRLDQRGLQPEHLDPVPSGVPRRGRPPLPGPSCTPRNGGPARPSPTESVR